MRWICAAFLILGVTQLQALPVIRGRVVRDEDGAPVPRARITRGHHPPVIAAADGSFAVTVEGSWPDDLVASASGRGSAIVVVPPAVHDVELPPIRLTAAGALKVVIERGGAAVPLEVALGARREGEESRWLESRHLAAGQSQLTFTNVGRGSYDVLVRGPQALQRTARQVVIGSGDRRSVRIPISWSFVRVRVSVGDVPLSAARLRVADAEGRWWTELTTDAGGEAQSAAWTAGRLRVVVEGGGLTAPYSTRVIIDDKPVQTLAIVVPDRRVTGRIVDAEGRGVSAAEISLRSEGRDTRPTVRVRTDADGRFVITGVRAGQQTLRVDGDGLLRPDALRFELAEDERQRAVDLVARSGRSVAFALRDRRGAAVAGALVVAASTDGRVRSKARSDERGDGAILLPAGERGVIYVFPREGSLATARIEPASDALRIVVPPPDATLRVATLSTTGTAIRDVALLLRVNGELIPPEVAEEWQSYRRLSLATDAEGHLALPGVPAGVYELWPYRSEAEAERLRESAVAAAAVVTVVPGENDVTLRFARKP